MQGIRPLGDSRAGLSFNEAIVYGISTSQHLGVLFVEGKQALR